MIKTILVHGWAKKGEYYNEKYPTSSNFHWLPWLSKQLMVRDIHTVALEMPRGYYPEYDVWRAELERFDIDEDTHLVGHSCGGGFLVRWLSENNKKVGRVILVAPWIGIDPGDDFDTSFFDFKIDKDIARKTDSITVFNSTNDVSSIQKSVKILKGQIEDVQYVEFNNKGHFTLNGMGTEEFPELLEELTR